MQPSWQLWLGARSPKAGPYPPWKGQWDKDQNKTRFPAFDGKPPVAKVAERSKDRLPLAMQADDSFVTDFQRALISAHP